jgi:hypothetical protein
MESCVLKDSSMKVLGRGDFLSLETNFDFQESIFTDFNLKKNSLTSELRVPFQLDAINWEESKNK